MTTTEDFFKEFNSIDWRTQWTLSALRAFDMYWSETEKLVAAAADAEEKANLPDWNPTNEDEYGEYRDIIRAVRHHHDEFILPTFRYAAVVSLFALLERELRRAADYIAAEDKMTLSYKGRNGTVIPLVAEFIQDRRGIMLNKLSGYSEITIIQKVRDCLVHCYGDIGLSRDRDFLASLSTQGRGIDAHPSSEMEIDVRFLEQSCASVRTFFMALFKELGWKIKDEWLKQK